MKFAENYYALIATINLNNVNPLSFQLKLYEDNNGTVNASFVNGDILLNPGETRRIALTYAPTAARQNFNLANGLVINSNAQNNSALNIQLAGKSTFNSYIS